MRISQPRPALWIRRFLQSAFASLLLMLGSPSASGEDAKLTVTANRNRIYLGEAVILSVKVSGVDSPPEPDLSGIPDCTTRFLGSQSGSSFSVIIINGRRITEGFSGRTFSYEVTPTKTGTFTAGPVRAEAGGRTLSEPGPAIEVVGYEGQNLVQLTVTSTRESVLVDEPFDVILTISIRDLEAQFAGTEPLNPGDPPVLNIPFMELSESPGLKGPDMMAILKSRLGKKNLPGFAVNSYTIRSDPFANFFNFDMDSLMEEEKAKFTFEHTIARRNSASFHEYRIALTYTGKEEGAYTFGPVTFKGNVVTGVDAAGYFQGSPVFAVGAARTVRVIPPPEEDRPATFIGGLGTAMKVESSLDTQTCRVGDPLTLTISVSGGVNLDKLYPPDLKAQPELLKTFKVYEDTVQTTTADGVKRFVYTIRPTRAGTLELPPIALSYFDTAERKYKTVESKPIPVRANQATEVGSEIVINTATNRIAILPSATEKELPVPAGITLNPAGAVPAELGLVRWHLWVLLGFPAIYAAVMLVRALVRHSPSFARRRRRRGALSAALSLLLEAERLSGTNPREACSLIASSIRRYLTDRFNLSPAGFTPPDADALLARQGADPGLRVPLVQIFQRAFDSGYADIGDVPVHSDPGRDAGQAAVILRSLDKMMSSGRKTERENT